MLSKEENLYLCSVGPDTPAGQLHRRYWQPISSVDQLNKNPVQKLRVLGEDLVLYRDLEGRYGLIGDKCPHRHTSMEYGVPFKEGLRCPYHGWMFGADGQCLDTPLEPAGSKLACKTKIKSYPVEELGGLLWAYMGPLPAPLLPRWDLFVWPRSLRQFGTCVVNCNWLQIQENGIDCRHNQYMHGHFFKYILERQGRWHGQGRPSLEMNSPYSKHEVIPHDHGFYQFVERKGIPPFGKDYRGHHGYVLFPYATRKGGKRVRGEFIWKVPIDDTHTMLLVYMTYTPPPGMEVQPQEVVPHFDIPLYDAKGQRILDCITHQDIVAWESQGPITDRSQEKLGASDFGIAMYRRLLKEQIEIVKKGGTPMNYFTDPEENKLLHLIPQMGGYDAEVLYEYKMAYWEDSHDRYGPLADDIRKLLEEVHKRGEEVLRPAPAQGR